MSNLKKLSEVAQKLQEAKYPTGGWYNKFMKLNNDMDKFAKFLKGEKGKWADGELDDDFEDGIASLIEAMDAIDAIAGQMEMLENEDG